MANMSTINQAIKLNFRDLDVRAVSGSNCISFEGDAGINIASINVNPASTSTEEAIRLVIDQINYHREHKSD